MERELRRHLTGGRFSNVPVITSKVMRAVKGEGNRTTEARLRLALVRAGIRGWIVRGSGLPGTPDFVFRRERVAVFADGCFWHGCRSCNPRLPRSNAAFWKAKMDMNRAKDRRHSRALRRSGWAVLRVWEHDIRGRLAKVVERISTALKSRKGVESQVRESP